MKTEKITANTQKSRSNKNVCSTSELMWKSYAILKEVVLNRTLQNIQRNVRGCA